jgi:hypothetical protein
MIFSDCCGTLTPKTRSGKSTLYACRKKQIRFIFFARNVERNKYDISVNVKRIISISFNIIVDNLILKGADYMESFEPAG